MLDVEPKGKFRSMVMKLQWIAEQGRLGCATASVLSDYTFDKSNDPRLVETATSFDVPTKQH